MASKQAVVLVAHAALVTAADVAAHLHVTRWNATVRDAQGNPIPGGYKAWLNASTGERVAWLPVDPANDVSKPFAYALDLGACPGAASVELSARAVSAARKAGLAKTVRVTLPVAGLPAWAPGAHTAASSKRAEAAKQSAATRARDPKTGRLLPKGTPVATTPAPAFAANASVADLATAIAGLAPEAQAALQQALAKMAK